MDDSKEEQYSYVKGDSRKVLEEKHRELLKAISDISIMRSHNLIRFRMKSSLMKWE